MIQKKYLFLFFMGMPCCFSFSTEVFRETFDDASSATRFNITSVAATTISTVNVYSEFGFDYSATGNSRLTNAIGPAPGGGSMNGLVLAANLNGGQRSAINLYPVISGFGLEADPTTGLPLIKGDYRMTFDFWSGVNNGLGTSESMQVGAQSNGDGTHINGFSDFGTSVSSPDSDFLEVNIPGDLSATDYISFTTVGGVPLDLEFIPNTNPNAIAAFPPEIYKAQPDGGAPAEVWATAEVRHEDGVTSFLFNDVLLTTIEFSDFGNDQGVDGLPWFGYTDLFNSQAGGDSVKVGQTGQSFDPFNASFIIIDNVVIEAFDVVPEPASATCLLISLLLITNARKID